MYLFKKLKIVISLLVLMNAWSMSLAQQSQVLVINDTSNTEQSYSTWVKWYSPDFVYPEGVNVYRRPVGGLQWEKLNTVPIQIGDSIAQRHKAADPDLEFFEEVLKTPEDAMQADQLFINMLIKTFQSNVFAEYAGIYYQDREVQWGTTYEYRVNKIVKGRELMISQSKPVKVGAFQPDIPVSELKIEQNKKKIEIDWKPEESRFYAVNIYQGTLDSAMQKVNKKPLMLTLVSDEGKMVYPTPKYVQDSLTEGLTYVYQVAGIGFFGEELQRTKPWKIPYKDTTPPNPPQGLSGDADSMKVTLQWKQIEDTDASGVNIYRSMHSDGPFEKVNKDPIAVSRVSYIDTVDIPGPYYYHIAAQDIAGNEANSTDVFVEVADVMPPATPQQVRIKVDTGRLRLDWLANTEKDLWGYLIFRSTTSGDEYIPLNVDPIKDAYYIQKIPKSVKSRFFYKVLAIDTAYNRSPLSECVHGRMPDVIAPERPRIKWVEHKENTLVIKWIPNVDEDLMGYHVYRYDSLASDSYEKININIIDGKVNGFTDRKAAYHRTYMYYVTAVDSVGNESKPSNIEQGYLYNEEAMEALGALKTKYNKKKHKLTLWWEANASTGLLGYVVYRGTSDATMRPLGGMQSEPLYTDQISKSELSIPLFYQVKAVSKDGHVVYSEILSWKNDNTSEKKK